MRVLGMVVAACVILSLSACSKKDDANKTSGESKPLTNADKIVGKWEVSKSKGMPPGAIIEFTKDGKMIMTLTIGGKTESAQGSYKVEGDKIVSTDPGGKKETITIKSLTDTKFVAVDEKGDTDEFTRK